MKRIKFELGSLILAGFITSGVHTTMNNAITRSIASVTDKYELQVQSIQLGEDSRLKALERVHLVATFNDKHIVEMGKDNPISLLKGESKELNFITEVQHAWLDNDNLRFKIEVVKDSGFQPVLVRCSITSKGISQFSRSYQCSLPNEKTPLLTYKLLKKDPEAISVGQTE